MQVVGICKDTGKLFTSRSCANEDEKTAAKADILNDAQSSVVEVEVLILTDEQVFELMIS